MSKENGLDLVDAVVKATGERVVVAQHIIDLTPDAYVQRSAEDDTPATPAPAPVAPAEPAGPQVPAPPSRNAKHADWVRYANRRGVDPTAAPEQEHTS
jgi:hypothetical protein